MPISEPDLRALVRGAIERHVGPRSPAPATAAGPAAALESACRAHASHAILLLPLQPDESCVIEPAVRCDHCGYCKSLGH
ncbi:MAG: hypothetical protein AB7Q29_12410 [Vicinamibacterales bacterium]